MDTAARVRELVAPSVESAGAELYDVELAGGVLRITLDRPGGVDIGVIGSVTRAISRLLDEVDPIPGEYTLEVSSPGLERPLRTPDHFARAVGSTVTVKTRSGVAGDRRVKGALVAAHDHGFTVRVDGATEDRTIAYGDIERVRTVFDWGPAPKPGRAPAGGAKTKKASGTTASPTSKQSSPEKKAATS
jgi:ribosome maturation factor RimP